MEGERSRYRDPGRRASPWRRVGYGRVMSGGDGG